MERVRKLADQCTGLQVMLEHSASVSIVKDDIENIKDLFIYFKHNLQLYTLQILIR